MNKNYILWLDDNRPVPLELWEKYKHKYKFIPCRSYGAARAWLKEISSSQPDAKIIISFDHDLGHGRNGYDVAKYIVKNKIDIFAYAIHSMNPVGRKNISDLLDHYGYRRVYGIFSII